VDDCCKCQTSTATPAEPGDLHWRLVRLIIVSRVLGGEDFLVDFQVVELSSCVPALRGSSCQETDDPYHTTRTTCAPGEQNSRRSDGALAASPEAAPVGSSQARRQDISADEKLVIPKEPQGSLGVLKDFYCPTGRNLSTRRPRFSAR
jgi:hypothetical protein